MINGVIIGDGLFNDILFDPNDLSNRDNINQPYITLQKYFRDHNIRLHTPYKCDQIPAFEIHFNTITNCKRNSPAYLLLLENHHIHPPNKNPPKYYRKVFTWRDDLVDGDRFIKMDLPNTITQSPVDGLKNRNIFCCMISGNKSVKEFDDRELYSERVKLIRWFEKNAPNDFDLYGTGWNCPPLSKVGRMSRLGIFKHRFWRFVAKYNSIISFFPSYRGRINSKNEVLLRTKYSICFENVRDMPGYITEKIFDSFFYEVIFY